MFQGRISQFSTPRLRFVPARLVGLSSVTSYAALRITCYLRMVIVDQLKVPPGLVPSLLQRLVADIMGRLKTQAKHAVTLCYNTPLPSVATQLFSMPKVVCIYHFSLPDPPSPNTSQLSQNSIRQGGQCQQQGRKGGQLPASAPGADGLCTWGETETQLNQAISCKATNDLHEAARRNCNINIIHTAVALVPNNVQSSLISHTSSVATLCVASSHSLLQKWQKISQNTNYVTDGFAYVCLIRIYWLKWFWFKEITSSTLSVA